MRKTKSKKKVKKTPAWHKNRATLKVLKQAYKDTGLTPIQGNWCSGGYLDKFGPSCPFTPNDAGVILGNGCRGCAMFAYAFAKTMTSKFMVADMGNEHSIAKYLKLPVSYVTAFIAAFDDSEWKMKKRKRQSEASRLGHYDGRRARSLLPKSKTRRAA